MSWFRLTTVENIPLREGRSVKIGDHEIALFNLGDKFAAVDNACPHRGGPLCDGIVTGEAVVCPLHAWKIDLNTGNVVRPEVCVRAFDYAVRVENGVVSVNIPESKLREEAA